jgi:hypothetical protein
MEAQRHNYHDVDLLGPPWRGGSIVEDVRVSAAGISGRPFLPNA